MNTEQTSKNNFTYWCLPLFHFSNGLLDSALNNLGTEQFAAMYFPNFDKLNLHCNCFAFCVSLFVYLLPAITLMNFLILLARLKIWCMSKFCLISWCYTTTKPISIILSTPLLPGVYRMNGFLLPELLIVNIREEILSRGIWDSVQSLSSVLFVF